MATNIQVDVQIMPDLNAEAVCACRWFDEKNEKIIDCQNPASWIADCHDEAESHTYETIILCGKCLFLAKMKKKCPDCGARLITNARKI